MKIKALSFRQPWAELVVQGKKTLDLRTWSTRYRGPLAIYASQTIEKDACLAHELDPEQLTTGAVIGTVELKGVIALDQATYHARTAEHLSGRRFQEPLFGWELADPQPLVEPFPVRGRLNLFDIHLPEPGEPLPASISHPVPALPGQDLQAAPWSSSRAFELRIIPETKAQTGQASYRLGLFQRKLEPPAAQPTLYQKPPEQMEQVVELGGVALRAIADQVLEALRENGYKVTDLNPTRREPFALTEVWGVRLSLLFLAVKPVSKTSRIEAISTGIRQMTGEELYYWYSKCTNRSQAERAQKALRTLLADK